MEVYGSFLIKKEINNMNKEYEEMELNILTCLILDPKKMEKLKIEDKYFVKYKRIWKFMRTFYDKYKTFDIKLMASLCANKKELVWYLKEIALNNALEHHFEMYQDELIYLANETIKERVLSNKIYNLANDLLARKITCADFDREYKKIAQECQ